MKISVMHGLMMWNDVKCYGVCYIWVGGAGWGGFVSVCSLCDMVKDEHFGVKWNEWGWFTIEWS